MTNLIRNFLLISVLVAMVSCSNSKPSVTKTNKPGSDSSATAKDTANTPVKVSHLMVCCQACNRGVKFLVNGKYRSKPDYTDISQVRSVLQKIKNAGINVVSVDMTNPAQWTSLWDRFKKIVDNIQKVSKKKHMQFFLFIGGQMPPGSKKAAFPFWNDVAQKILKLWTDDATYRKYGFGDNSPILLVFLPAQAYWPQYNRAGESNTNYLAQFHIGTTQVNDPITPEKSDGWGYRNTSQSSDGSVRFVSPNGAVAPDSWYKVSAGVWARRVQWALHATQYSVIGSYDDTCDGIEWGIAKTKDSQRAYNIYPDSGKDPRIYYNIVKKYLNPGK